jgi:hypothetical protein
MKKLRLNSKFSGNIWAVGITMKDVDEDERC